MKFKFKVTSVYDDTSEPDILDIEAADPLIAEEKACEAICQAYGCDPEDMKIQLLMMEDTIEELREEYRQVKAEREDLARLIHDPVPEFSFEEYLVERLNDLNDELIHLAAGADH